MTRNAYDKIAAGLKDALAFADGTADYSRYNIHVPPEKLKEIRKHLGLSQVAFARRYGFSVGRIRDWEQGRSPIDTPSLILLTVLDKEPEAVERALSAA